VGSIVQRLFATDILTRQLLRHFLAISMMSIHCDGDSF
jgi:hypothetical protein